MLARSQMQAGLYLVMRDVRDDTGEVIAYRGTFAYRNIAIRRTNTYMSLSLAGDEENIWINIDHASLYGITGTRLPVPSRSDSPPQGVTLQDKTRWESLMEVIQRVVQYDGVDLIMYRVTEEQYAAGAFLACRVDDLVRQIDQESQARAGEVLCRARQQDVGLIADGGLTQVKKPSGY